MYLKDKSALITTIIKVVADRLGVDAAACLQPSAPRCPISKARIFISHILIRRYSLVYDDVVAALNYSERISVWYALKSATKKLTRRPDARLMRECCKEIANQLEVSKTSVQTTDSPSEFLKSPLPTFSGYHPAPRL